MNQLFTEKFRPSELEDLILPDRIKSEVENGLKQNILLYSSAGRGKTTLAKILSNGLDTLYINVSDDNGIDTVRDTIVTFCSTLSVVSGSEQPKCIILDEMDGGSLNFFKALRATMEKFPDTRFIGTCNYITKIPDPIQSRFQCINFEFVSKEEEKQVMVGYLKRAKKIFDLCSIEISKEALVEFIKRNFPDMRVILNKIQSFYIKGLKKIEVEDIKSINYAYDDIFKLISSDPRPEENYKEIMANYAAKVEDVLGSIGSEFPEWLKEHHPDKMQKLPQVIITVAEYQAQRVNVIDPAISLLACCFKIQQILNS